MPLYPNPDTMIYPTVDIRFPQNRFDHGEVMPISLCTDCGALVWDAPKHKAWHGLLLSLTNDRPRAIWVNNAEEQG